MFAGERRAGLVVDGYVLDAEPGGLAVELDGESGRVRVVESLDPRPSVDASVRLGVAELGTTVTACDDPLLASRARVLVAAMQLGIADAVRDMSVAYAKERMQFGKPIGT